VSSLAFEEPIALYKIVDGLPEKLLEIICPIDYTLST
jgi:hypothetical protein